MLTAFESSDDKQEIFKRVEKIFANNTSGLSEVLTEWQCLHAFERAQSYIPPQEYSIGERLEFRRGDDAPRAEMVDVTGQFIPLRKTLKIFFEMPRVLDETLDYIKDLKNHTEVMSNFIQGELWKDMSLQFGEQLVFPLFMYFDDYENNNPLGSHRGISKCGAVYISIPCLPPAFASKLQNIFLFTLFNSLDRTTFKNKLIFSKVIDELLYLETTGIIINHRNQELTIFFKLALILGDNLGLHSLLGFTESFNVSCVDGFCRFCCIKKQEINNIVHESQCKIRTVTNYETDLERDDKKVTGIVENCLFHRIPGFHVTTNLSVDVMHDMLEGICQYDLALIFRQFINTDKFFSLIEVNNRIRGFNYGSTKNKQTEILLSHIKNKRIIMSASEMLSLVRYVSLIFGPVIPNDNKTWNLYLQLRNIVELCVSSHLHINTPNTLQIMITDYLNSLNTLFPNSLKPKHHFLIHYPRVLSLTGPLWESSSMRVESKHRDGKVSSRVAISRVNVCRTIATKHQLQLNYQILSMDEPSTLSFRNEDVEITLSSNCPDLIFFKNLLPNKMQCLRTLSLLKKIEFEGLTLREIDVLRIISSDEPSFYKIFKIIVNKDKDVCIVTKLMTDVFYDEHVASYQIFSPTYDWRILSIDDLYCCASTYIARACDGTDYVVKKWY